MINRRFAAGLRSEASVAIAMSAMNVATYGYTILAARLMGPEQYGAFIAAMNLVMVISVASLGLQATGARRIAAERDHVRTVERVVLRVTLRVALGLGGVLLVLAPVVDLLLQLDSVTTATMVALSAVPLTLMGGQAGILQGERRWGALGLVYLAVGVPRLLVGTAFLVWRPDVVWAMAGVAVAMCTPAIVGWWALRRDSSTETDPPGRPTATEGRHPGLAVLREILHNSQALFAFFALYSVDIIVARNVLDDRGSGLYAAGLILTKAMLFLPQFVVVVAFPSMATPTERRRALVSSLGLVLALGVVGAVAAWALSSVALTFVGGAEFAEVKSRLWLFALLGTVLSMVQLLVYSALARQGRASVWLVWLALVIMVGLGLLQSSLTGLVVVVVLVDVALLTVLLVVSGRLVRRPASRSSSPSGRRGRGRSRPSAPPRAS